MKKLSDKQRREKAVLVGLLRTAKDGVEAAIGNYNRVCNVAAEQVASKIKQYNALLERVRKLQENVRDAQDAFKESQSENWQYSDEALAYETWCDQWEFSGPLDDADLEIEPIALELTNKLDHADDLAALDDEFKGEDTRWS